jgi:hypothetical protein
MIARRGSRREVADHLVRQRHIADAGDTL